MSIDPAPRATEAHSAEPPALPEPEAPTVQQPEPDPVVPAAPRTRRSVIAAALGGLTGLLAGRLGRPGPVAAAPGDTMKLGQANDSGTAQTTLTNAGLGAAFTLKTTNSATGATGIFGWTSQTGANATRGVYGKADGPNSHGVFGRQSGSAGSGAAVYAEGNQNTGVHATSDGAGRYALYGVASADGGTGVTGWASASSGGSQGVYGLASSTSGRAVLGFATAGSGLTFGVVGQVNSTAGVGVQGFALAGSGSGIGVKGESNSPTGMGVMGTSTSGVGVWGTSTSSRGVVGASTSNLGVWGDSNSATGVRGTSQSEIGVHAISQAGATKSAPALRAENHNTTNGMAAYLTNDSAFATAHFYNAGTGQVLWLENGGTDANGTGGGDFITAVNEGAGDAQFRVLTSGEVRSDVGFNTPAADFAEMMPATEGLEPGDVLVVGADGRLARSSEPHQESLVGVHSTRPGFVGGSPVGGNPVGHIPLAVVGIVPVKASAENGPIRVGDLLTSSATPGHAMRTNGEARIGCVIGKALEGLDAATGRISMLVVLQ